MKRLLLLISLILMFTGQSIAQHLLGSISGTIVDKKTGEPLPGVNVQIVGTYIGTSANLDGRFMLKKIPLKQCTLRFSMIGYKTKEVPDIVLELGTAVEIPPVELETTVIGMNPVVVTASKQRQDLKVIPHSISVLPEVEMVERVPLRLDNALESVAGVHFVENHINIRGSSGYTRGVGSRVLLVIDEVPMMNSDNNEINWNILPILDIDQIEVIKGAGSALYGSNALGGVVNVITKSPTEKGHFKVRTVNGIYDKPPHAREEFYGIGTRFPLVEWQWTNRSLNFAKRDISYSKQIKNLGVNLAFGQHQSTGYRTDGEFLRWNVSSKLQYQFPDASRLVMYGAYSHENRQEFIEWQDQHNAMLSSPYYSDAEYKINAFDTYMLYHKPISSTLGVKVRASFITSLMGDQYNRSTDYFPAEGFGSELKVDWLPFSSHNLTFGTEYRIDGGHTKYIGDHQGFSVAPYVQDQWQVFKMLAITMGIRYDQYWLKNSDYSENHLNPKLGINFNPFEGTILRFSGGSGFRAASIFERYLNFKYKLFTAVPNPDLKAETSNSFDLGIHQQITNSWWVDGAVFYNRYYNYIEPQEDILDDFSLQVQFRNVVDARIRGFELSTKGSWWQDHIGLQANLTMMDAKDLNDYSHLAYRPKMLSFITPSFTFAPFEFQVEYRYASRFNKVMLYTYDQRVAQKVWTYRLFIRFPNFTAIFALNNAYNYAYTQLERNMSEPRNVTVTFMYDLK
ncbi:TonB-dependent receptor [candidate division KSB1 bacterium]|nr:TonB-dependent receptor [candidate division KSB1 bacterium]